MKEYHLHLSGSTNPVVLFNKNDGWVVSLGETRYVYHPTMSINMDSVFRDVIRAHFIEKGKKQLR